MAILTRDRFRRYSSARWAELNPILLDGEPGWDSTLKQLKVGDGETRWVSLDWLDGGGGGGGVGVTDGDKGDIVVSSSGANWQIEASAVGTAEIANLAVTTAKVADGAVTGAKLGVGAVTVGTVSGLSVVDIVYDGSAWPAVPAGTFALRRFWSPATPGAPAPSVGMVVGDLWFDYETP